MNISRVSIRNVRSIERIDMDLVAADGNPRRRLILLGGNGVGKTTTLLAIAHTLGAESHEFGAYRLGADDIRKVGSSGAGTAVPELPEAYVELQVRASREDRAWWSDLYRDSDLPDVTALRSDLPGTGKRYERTESASNDAARLRSIIAGRGAPPALFLPATRGTLESTDDVSVASLDAFTRHGGCLSSARQRFELIPSLLALAFVAPERNDRDGTVQRMWRVLEKYFDEMPRPVGIRGLQLLFETRDGAVVPLARLSDGQRALLLIVADIALRDPSGGVVLIDEIEQHLHPRWQRNIVEALPAMMPTTQFIFTSQAPYLAASAPDDLIVMSD